MIDDSALHRALRGVDRLFEVRAAEDLAPSSAYGIFTRGGLVHTGSTGEVGGQAPSPDTIYRIASCTKSFTATALLALRDAGTVTLDDPVTDYIPAFADVRLPSADSPVPTLRMLLTMSGGLPTDDPWGDRQESITDDELDALLSTGLRFDSRPGARFAYSNLGYALLGRVVSVASGRGYRDVVTDRILRPLGLDSTGFTRPEGVDERLAIGHRKIDGAWEALPSSGPGGFSSIGGIYSTVTDLSRWSRWLVSAFDDGEPAPGDHDGILSRASRRELQQMYRLAPAMNAQPTGYGFGLFIEEHADLGTVVSHSGGYPGFSAHMRWHPASGLGVVAFENATYAQVSVPAASALHALLHDVRAVPEKTVWPEVVAARPAVERAILGEQLPAELVSENIDLDLPLAYRRAAWQAAVEQIGGLVGPATARGGGGVVEAVDGGGVAEVVDTRVETPIDTEAGEESSAPSHLVWRMAGARGRLRVEIRMTPEGSPRIQTLAVRAERLG